MARFDTHHFARRLKGSGFSDAQVDELIEMAKASVPDRLVTEDSLERALQMTEQRLTIRLGGIVVVAFGILFGLLRVFPVV